jgi:hypothetical protein
MVTRRTGVWESDESPFRAHDALGGFMKALATLIVVPLCLVAAATGCSPSLAAPFDTLKKDNAPMTVFRLQNFEPPAAAAGAAPSGPIP